ncbi:MAG: DUF3037 domain-containing protein [Candidatus Acidiferrales bacterium]
MAEDNLRTLTYRILRYTPNIIRDEWVNVGVILEDNAGELRQARLIEEPAELARVRRLHPAAEEAFLRALPLELETILAAPVAFAKLDDTLSNAIQFSSRKAVLAEDFDAELDRLYREHVAPPPAPGRAGILENTRAWIRTKLNDVFRRHRILDKVQRGVRVEEFTQPGDPLRLDYGYRFNGTRGFVQTVPLGRDPAQAKILVYTAERIRARLPLTEFTAVTEIEPASGNPRHQFVARLFEEQRIAIVPLNRVEKFADSLRMRIN